MGRRTKRVAKGAAIAALVLAGMYLLGELMENRSVRRTLRVLEGAATLGVFVFLFRGDEIISWWKNRKRRALLLDIAQGAATCSAIDDRLAKLYAKYADVEAIPPDVLDSMHRARQVLSMMHATLEPLMERASKAGLSDDEIEREIEHRRRAIEQTGEIGEERA